MTCNQKAFIVRLFMTLIGLMMLLAVGAFCTFGFMATFEPTDNPRMFLAFRVGYAAVGLGCVVGTVFMIVKSVRR